MMFLLQNYSKVCKNVGEVKINNEFSIRGARCAGFYIPEGDETHSVEFYINSAGKLVLLLPEENIYFVKNSYHRPEYRPAEQTLKRLNKTTHLQKTSKAHFIFLSYI